MKKNLLKTIALAIIMIMGISSVCFADVIMLPGDNLAWSIRALYPVLVILLVLSIIETISFYFLWKSQNEDEVEKERREEKLKTAKYHLLFMITVFTLLIPMINIISLFFLCISIVTFAITKNKENTYNVLRYYLIGMLIVVVTLLFI